MDKPLINDIEVSASELGEEDGIVFKDWKGSLKQFCFQSPAEWALWINHLEFYKIP